MKKIILALDEIHFSEGAFNFARRLNELSPILLTGVFLPQPEYSNLWSYAWGGVNPLVIPFTEENESEIVQKNVSHFEKLCQRNDIDYRVHKDFFDSAITELEKESCYADLLILSSEKFYSDINIDASSNDYLQSALHHVKCPVLLVSEKFIFPESIILAYDGTEDSVFAIKQFAYLVPQLTSKPAILVYANNNEEKDFPDKIQIEELAARHFSDLTLLKLNINPKKDFATWISEQSSAILISGSYGRSGLSQLFKKSFIKDVIADHQLPIFIAHK